MTNSNDKYRVLIVDDQVYNLDALCQILSPIYDVKTAKSGEAAIRMAEKHNPALILLDVLMPDMSGFDTLVRLKESDITRNIPVIFITGLDSSRDEEKGLLLGAADYITKPFNDAVIKLRVKSQIRIIEQMRTIERLGMIDALTDIPNRRGFDHQLNVEWGRATREGAPTGILMIDIDKFKDFNDNYGHAHGDEVLKSVASMITNSVRRASDFAARWGGEEFIVLLPNTDMDGAASVAEMIRVNVEKMKVQREDGTETGVRVSIGVNSEIPGAHSKIDEFIAKADKALYQAKQTGRNKVCRYQ